MIKQLSQQLLARRFKIVGYIVFSLSLMFSIQTGAHDNHKNVQHKHETAPAVSAQLVVLEVTKQGPQIKKLNLNNGEAQVLYNIPKGDKLFQFSHASNKSELLLSYFKKATGEQGIWKLSYSVHSENSASSKLVPILVDKDAVSWFFDPISAPVKDTSGNGMYFISANVDQKTQRASKDLSLNYINLSSMEQKVVAKNARDPRISEKGRYLSWVQSSKNPKSINVLDIKNQTSLTFSLESAKPNIHHALINEYTRSLLFFSDNKQLMANNFLRDLSMVNVSIINSAQAHTGHKHRDYFGWQLPLASENVADNKVVNDANATQLWQVKDIRAFDMSGDGKHAIWVNNDGLSIVNIDNQKKLLSINNPNLWKVRWIH